MIKDQDISAYRIEFVIVSTGLTLISGTVGDLTPQREQENTDISQPHKDTPGRKAKPNSKLAKKPAILTPGSTCTGVQGRLETQKGCTPLIEWPAR